MVGRAIAHARERTGRVAASEELLRVEKLSRHGVLEDISFSVHSGEVVGLAGLRGAGRTEVVRAIFGADPIDGGQIYIKGKPIHVTSPRGAVDAAGRSGAGGSRRPRSCSRI